MPCKNSSCFLRECLESVLAQGEFIDPRFIELSVFDDGSEDDSLRILHEWEPRLRAHGFGFVLSAQSQSRGCGFARNRAVEQSSGNYLCFLDSDDVMMPERCAAQLSACWEQHDLIVGSMYIRVPINATIRYSEWHNSITHEQLITHQFKECTLAMPTWSMSRALFDRIGGFCEDGAGTPEDLIFFHRHLQAGGRLARLDKVLLLYRYHPSATTASVLSHTITAHKVAHLEAGLLSRLKSFSIWGGKLARELFRSLSPQSQAKVVCFLDIDPAKVGTHYYCRGMRGAGVPVRHWAEAGRDAGCRPLVLCVKPGLTDGAFEANLAALRLREGEDYWPFG